MTWVFLIAAILFEVSATISLRIAVTGRNVWYAPVVVGYLLAFTFLSLTLSQGLGIGIAYGIWAASGVALTAIASKYIFGEPLTRIMGLGIVCIIAGVLLIELGASH